MYWKGLFPRALIPILETHKGTRLVEEGREESRGETTQRGMAEVHQKQYGSSGALLHWIRLMTGSRWITKEQRRVQSRFWSFTSSSLPGFYQGKTWGHNAMCVVSSESKTISDLKAFCVCVCVCVCVGGVFFCFCFFCTNMIMAVQSGSNLKD